MSTLVRHRYRVLERLGSGGGGSVFAVADLGLDPSGHHRLALKALFFEGGDDHVLLELLRQEFRVLATLNHPRLARVHDFGHLPADAGLDGSRGRPGYFLTRDLIEGSDLLAATRKVDLATICRLARQTALLLDVLHDAGMVHGDFKPANVIVDAQSLEPHLIDFGLVRGEGTSMFSGTAAYLPPEVVSGQQTDRRADLYSFGITLYQLLVGTLPLARASIAELIDWHLHGDPLALAERPDAPSSLDAIVRRLTERDPDRRYASAKELAAALEHVLRELGAAPQERLAIFVPPPPGARLGGPLAALEEHVRARLGARQPSQASLASAVVVRGEAGNGKSVLLRELSWRCQLAGYEVLRGAFRPGDVRLYGPLGELLDQLEAIHGLPQPLMRETPETPAPGAFASDGADRYAIVQQFADYLAATAGRLPLVLVFDAVEHADEESRAALRFLAHTLDARAPILLILAHDPDSGLEEALADLPAVELGGLDEAEVEGLLTACQGATDGAADLQALAHKIHAHTGGNAQFVLDVLRALGEAGWPAHPDLSRLAPPASLEQRVTERWQRAKGEERRVLAALAVMGQALDGLTLVELLEAVEAFAPAESLFGADALRSVGLPLERLEVEGWLSRSADGGWAFREGAAAHTVRTLLTPAQLGALHRAAFERLVGAGDAHVVERARHGLAAGEFERTALDCENALGRLVALGAYRQAIALLDAALHTLGEGDGRARRFALRRGELLGLAGDHEAAVEALTPLCQGEDEQALAARLELARAERLAGRPAAALESLAVLVSSKSPRALRLAGLAAKAAAQAVLDQHDAVLSTVDEALVLLAAGEGDAALEAELHGRRAWSLGYQEKHEEASSAFDRALARARAAGARRVEADLLNRWAVVSWRHGDYEGVEQRYGLALATLTSIGEIERAAVVRFNLAGFQLQRGLLASALTHLEGSLRLFEGMGTRQNAATARCNLGQLQLELGLHEQARSTLERALAEMRDSGRTSGEALAGLLLALVAARRRDFDEARRGVAKARQIYLSIGQPRDAADALLDLAELELEAGLPEAATRAITEAEGEVNLAEVADLEVRALTLHARVLARQGTAAGQSAQELLQRAFSRAESIDSPELNWRCHAAAMELQLAAGARAQAAESARQGAAILAQMSAGLPPDVLTAFWADPRRRAARQLARTFRTADQSSSSVAPSLSNGPTLLAATLPPEQSVRLTEERFYRLLEIYRQVNSELDPERLLGLVMDTAVELTGAERGFLLLGERLDELRVEVTRNIDPEGASGAYSRSIAERVIKSGEPVITVSAHNDPRFVDYASVHQLRLESVLCIPVHARGRVAGVLYMESRFTSGRFTPADQRLLMAFGDQVAIALTNARLYAENVRKTRELEHAKKEIEALAEERGRLLTERTAQLEEARLDLAETRRHLQTRTGRFGLVGASKAMDRLFEVVARVAGTDVPVLIEGESGTGKEMVARALHNESSRAKKRMVSVNCAAIPENLLESELFGHVRGAFTGADREKKGLFATADGGTLFLDEIGDMPPRMQVDMLRALQEKTIRPVGGQRDIEVDVRVIAASNKPLKEQVRQGHFREDLFYRLHVIRLDLPPLRERSDDIPLLVDHFLARIATQMGVERRKITRRGLRHLMEYAWPGNVRQLEHALVNAAVLAEGDVLDAEDFTLESPRDISKVVAGAAAPEAVEAPSAADREVQERQRIVAALEEHNWNKSKAAAALGIPRRTFYRRLTAYGID